MGEQVVVVGVGVGVGVVVGGGAGGQAGRWRSAASWFVVVVFV